MVGLMPHWYGVEEIPTDEVHRADYVNDFLAMSKAIKKCQRKDGFWNVSLHDETNFGGKETSGYGFVRLWNGFGGVRNGLLIKKSIFRYC